MCQACSQAAWWCQAGLGHFGQTRVDRVGRDRRQQQVLSLAVSLVFRCEVAVKPVHSSTSISNSVILRCGSSACLVDHGLRASGTAASSGVIFRPDAVVMASGKSLAAAMRLTVASCASTIPTGHAGIGRSRWPLPAAILASFKVANFSTGTVYSSKSLNWREPCTQTSPERSAFFSSDRAHNS